MIKTTLFGFLFLLSMQGHSASLAAIRDQAEYYLDAGHGQSRKVDIFLSLDPRWGSNGIDLEIGLGGPSSIDAFLTRLKNIVVASYDNLDNEYIVLDPKTPENCVIVIENPGNRSELAFYASGFIFFDNKIIGCTDNNAVLLVLESVIELSGFRLCSRN